ncbi:MAG: M50 family metallopeptidase [Solobacterium sp.]|nr:M50 family metallopeptidase [Solobacterium sp.]
MNSKAKKQQTQVLGIVLYMLIGAACGILIISYMEKLAEAGLPAIRLLMFIPLMLSIYAAFLLQTVIHEAGHLVFGLATGYRFVSFRVFSWMWIKKDGKLHFKRMSLAGTGGQCLMSPPDLKNGKIPVLLYNFGGAFMNVIASAVFLSLSVLFPPVSFFRVFLRILALIGFAFALMNGIPLHLGPADNDGSNALALMRSEEAVRAYWIQMKGNEQAAAGIRIKDMPEEWFAVPDDRSMNNSMIASVGVLACSRLMDEHRFAEADALMEHMLSIESRIMPLHRSLLACERIFVELIGENDPDKLNTLLTEEQKKKMAAMESVPSVLRTEYAYALLAEHDTEKAKKIEREFEDTASDYPYSGELAGEMEFMKMIRGRAGLKE